MMINYVYKLAEIEDNHEAYTSKGRIAAGSAVKGLAKYLTSPLPLPAAQCHCTLWVAGRGSGLVP